MPNESELYLKIGDLYDNQLNKNNIINTINTQDMNNDNFVQPNQIYQPWLDSSRNEQIDVKCKNGENGEMSDSWKALHKSVSATHILETDRRTTLLTGEVKRDSRYMRPIKKHADLVVKFLAETEIANDNKEFEEQRQYVTNLYDGLIRSCDTYLQKRKYGLRCFSYFYKGEGYRRYQLVKDTYTRARSEYSMLKNRSANFHEDFNGEKDRPLWINVLSECRTKRITLDNQNANYKTGNCNTVIEVTLKDGKKGYIKENEYNCSVNDKTKQYIEKTMQSDTVKELEENNKLLGSKPEARTKNIRYIFEFIEEYLQDENNASDFMKATLDCDDYLKNGQLLNSFIKKIREWMNKHENPENPGDDKWAYADDIIDILSELGKVFHGKQDKEDQNNVKQLIGRFGSYYYRATMSNSIATNIAGIPENANITGRNVATYRLAELLGISELIPAATKVLYKDKNGNEHKGILMAGTVGEPVARIKYLKKQHSQKIKLEKEVYLQLVSLQILDILTGQVDRHEGNILLQNVQKLQHYSKVTGIDNDMCFGNISYYTLSGDMEFLKPLSAKIHPLENEKGTTLKMIDQELFDRVLGLDESLVRYAFADLLQKEEMEDFLDRIDGVQELFHKLKNEKNPSVKLCDRKKMTEDDANELMYYALDESYLNGLPYPKGYREYSNKKDVEKQIKMRGKGQIIVV